jgi:hypothetical protein
VSAPLLHQRLAGAKQQRAVEREQPVARLVVRESGFPADVA